MPMNIPKWTATWVLNRRVMNGNCCISAGVVIAALRQRGIVTGESHSSLYVKVGMGIVSARKKHERFLSLVKNTMNVFGMDEDVAMQVVFDEVIKTRHDINYIKSFLEYLLRSNVKILPNKRITKDAIETITEEDSEKSSYRKKFFGQPPFTDSLTGIN